MGSLVDVLVSLAALVAILDYFGIKPKSFSEWKLMPLSRKWKLAFMLLLVVVSLAMSGYSLFKSTYSESKFAWTGIEPPKRIVGRQFENQKIYLDDAAYADCTFYHVTFVYNGIHKTIRYPDTQSPQTTRQ